MRSMSPARHLVLGGLALASMLLLLGIQLTAAAVEGFPRARASLSPRATVLWKLHHKSATEFCEWCYHQQADDGSMQWQSLRTTKGIKVPAGPVQGVCTLSWWASPACCRKIAKKAFSTYSCTFVHNAACSQSMTHLRCACVYVCSVPNPSNPASAKQCGERRKERRQTGEAGLQAGNERHDSGQISTMLHTHAHT